MMQHRNSLLYRPNPVSKNDRKYEFVILNMDFDQCRSEELLINGGLFNLAHVLISGNRLNKRMLPFMEMKIESCQSPYRMQPNEPTCKEHFNLLASLLRGVDHAYAQN